MTAGLKPIEENEISQLKKDQNKEKIAKHLLDIIAIHENNFPVDRFSEQCVIISQLDIDKTAFVNYWKNQYLDQPELKNNLKPEILEKRKTIDLFVECVNRDWNLCANLLYNQNGVNVEGYYYLLELCAEKDANIITRSWQNYTKEVNKSVIDNLKRLYEIMVGKTKMKGIIAGGKIIRLILGIDGGDTDFFVTGIETTNEEKISDLPTLKNGAYMIGNCITSACDKYQYIISTNHKNEDIVRNFDMAHLEMYFDGENLYASNMAILCLQIKKTYSRFSYLEARRVAKYFEMGFGLPQNTIIINEKLEIYQLGENYSYWSEIFSDIKKNCVHKKIKFCDVLSPNKSLDMFIKPDKSLIYIDNHIPGQSTFTKEKILNGNLYENVEIKYDPDQDSIKFCVGFNEEKIIGIDDMFEKYIMMNISKSMFIREVRNKENIINADVLFIEGNIFGIYVKKVYVNTSLSDLGKKYNIELRNKIIKNFNYNSDSDDDSYQSDCSFESDDEDEDED